MGCCCGQLELLDARRSEPSDRQEALQERAAQYQATLGLIRVPVGGCGGPPVEGSGESHAACTWP